MQPAQCAPDVAVDRLGRRLGAAGQSPDDQPRARSELVEMHGEDVPQLSRDTVPGDRVTHSFGDDEAHPDVGDALGACGSHVVGQMRDDASAGGASPTSDG